MKTTKLPISIVAGIIIILTDIFSLSISLILIPPPYNPLTNMISDLGHPRLNPKGAIFFNLGCIVMGITVIFFYFGFYQWYLKGKWDRLFLKIIQIFGMISGTCLLMLGVYHEGYMPIHGYWAVAFFIFNMISMMLGSIYYYRTPGSIKVIALYGFVASLISLFFLFLSFTPLLEWLTVIFCVGNVGLTILGMLKVYKKSKK